MGPAASGSLGPEEVRRMKTDELTEKRLVRRMDTTGQWHRVATAPCEACGCAYDFSLDEPGIIWEPGEVHSPDCLDDLCDCHVFPVMGLRFKLNLAS